MRPHLQAPCSSSQIPQKPTPPAPPPKTYTNCSQRHPRQCHLLVPLPPPAPAATRQSKLARRDLFIGSSSLPLLFWNYFEFSQARADPEADNTLKIDFGNAREEGVSQDTNLSNIVSENAQEEIGNKDTTVSNTNVGNGQETIPSEASNVADVDSGNAVNAEENIPTEASNVASTNSGKNREDLATENSSVKPAGKRAFLDVSIDGQPAGRIVVGLYENKAPVGTSRFLSLVTGAAGISYRRKEFVKIMPNYIQHGGVRSYGVDAELANNRGTNLIADNLLAEWELAKENVPGTKNVAGSLGIVIRDPLKPPPKLKLVARKGKLEIDEEAVGTDPNGTEFIITTKDSPDLDASTLVVGKVLEGMDVVEKISKVKTVQENTSSPYFRVAKLIGDKRAVVAERGFNRPYSKVIITNCGLIN